MLLFFACVSDPEGLVEAEAGTPGTAGEADASGEAEGREESDGSEGSVGSEEHTGIGGAGGAGCASTGQVVIYTQSAWNVLAEALAADASPCMDYYISIPAPSGDKTSPRAGEAEGIRALGDNFHAMAEFHWTGWSGVSGSWEAKGEEFRRRMEAAGYDVEAGDTWAINELPSSVRSSDDARADAVDALAGLAGADEVKGAVFIVGMGHSTVYFSTYEANLRDWLQDRTFWEQVNKHARWWGQEVYADPDRVCVSGTTVATRSSHVNAYVQHVARLAEVGPDSANTAQSYLGRAYTPVMNAVWGSEDSGYGDTTVTLDQMKHHVSTQVYAARAWSASHGYPDWRLGFAWGRTDGTADDDLSELGARMASAIRHAYAEDGGTASRACSPSGAFTWCACHVEGAAFNEGWGTFSSW